ncbi:MULTISPECIES: LysE family translocator [Salinivibrio]|jgi:Putative threonine efflux protein|uniref:LysE family translocator n=1 Tax=Salinivibrio TaxID=51366 RepID=UPI00039552D3|nr:MULTISPECIES: LysE family translocator [unclassified Salinivibrio]OOE88472.1 threonine transporter [Salinivibrio sp. AR640]OOE90485.1 threonine transporter [Salinivibrio sp. AR647]OOE96377.1 threonine transporter [Salinivibrio sp. IB643]OOF03305.1 threonine transporter [Salinivibrio sp. MA440]
MNELTILATLAGVHMIALLSPGPDFALVLQNATRYGRATGLAIALGLSLSILAHTILSITGISLLVHQHPQLFMWVQVAGGSVLMYLGLSAIKGLLAATTAPVQTANDAPAVRGQKQAFWKGVLTNLFNPKALVFFISLMSTLVPASMSASGKAMAVAVVFLLSLGWFSSLAWLLSGSRVQQVLTKVAPVIDGLCALLFLLLGGAVVWQAGVFG